MFATSIQARPDWFSQKKWTGSNNTIVLQKQIKAQPSVSYYSNSTFEEAQAKGIWTTVVKLPLEFRAGDELNLTFLTELLAHNSDHDTMKCDVMF